LIYGLGNLQWIGRDSIVSIVKGFNNNQPALSLPAMASMSHREYRGIGALVILPLVGWIVMESVSGTALPLGIEGPPSVSLAGESFYPHGCTVPGRCGTAVGEAGGGAIEPDIWFAKHDVVR